MRTQPLKFVQYIIYCIIFTRPQPLKLNKKATRQQNQKFQKGMLHPDHLPKKENVKLKATRQQIRNSRKECFIQTIFLRKKIINITKVRSPWNFTLKQLPEHLINPHISSSSEFFKTAFHHEDQPLKSVHTLLYVFKEAPTSQNE